MGDILELPLERIVDETLGEPLLAVRIPGGPQPVQRVPTSAGGRILGISRGPDYQGWIRVAVRMLKRWRIDTGREPIAEFVWAGVTSVYARPTKPPRGYRLRRKGAPASERSTFISYPWPWTDGRNPCGAGADVDNLLKGPVDALVESGLLLDDRLVMDLRPGGRWYAARGEQPCMEVRLWRAAPSLRT